MEAASPSKRPTLKDAPYAENSNDSAWLANADHPLTGYERVFGTIGTPRSLRTRGGIEDVAAMADKDATTKGLLLKGSAGSATRWPGRWPGWRWRAS